jgi:hypothetical protein
LKFAQFLERDIWNGDFIKSTVLLRLTNEENAYIHWEDVSTCGDERALNDEWTQVSSGSG